MSTEGASGPNGQHELVQMRAPPATPRPKLLAAGALGLYGFCAIDLCHYAFTPKPKAAAEGADPPPVPTSKGLLYPSLAHAFGVPWSKLSKRVPRVYPALQLLLEQGNETPVEALEQARLAKLKQGSLSESFLREPVDGAFVAKLARHAASEFPATCAIMGGVVGAEVIKIIERKEIPMNNLFIFDGTTGLDASGVVHRMGPSFRCPWGVDRGAPRDVQAADV